MPDPFAPNQQYATNAGQVTQLPMQYQQGIDAAMLKRQLGAMLMQRGIQPLQGREIVTGAGAPNRFVKSSPWEVVGQLAQQLTGAQMMQQSQAALMETAARYQDTLRSTGQQIMGGDPVPITSGGAPTQGQALGGVVTPPSARGPSGGPLADQIAEARVRAYSAATSQFPEWRDRAKIFEQQANELEMKNAQLVQEDKWKRIDSGAPVATAESRIAAAKSGDPSALQSPLPLNANTGVPGVSDMPSGERAIQDPLNRTVKIEATKASREEEARQSAQNAVLNKVMDDYRTGYTDMSGAAQTAVASDAMSSILKSGKAFTGALVETRAELARLSQLLPGVKLSDGATYYDVLRGLSPAFLAGIRNLEAGGSIRNFAELKYFANLGGMDFAHNTPALLTNLDNYSANIRAQINRYNRQLENDSHFAATLQRPQDAERLLHWRVSDDQLAPVSTGLPPQPFREPPPPGQPAVAIPFRSRHAPPPVPDTAPLFDPRTMQIVPR